MAEKYGIERIAETLEWTVEAMLKLYLKPDDAKARADAENVLKYHGKLKESSSSRGAWSS